MWKGGRFSRYVLLLYLKNVSCNFQSPPLVKFPLKPQMNLLYMEDLNLIFLNLLPLEGSNLSWLFPGFLVCLALGYCHWTSKPSNPQRASEKSLTLILIFLCFLVNWAHCPFKDSATWKMAKYTQP